MDDVRTSTETKPSEHSEQEMDVEITSVVKKPQVDQALAEFSDDEVVKHGLDMLINSRPFRHAFRTELKKLDLTTLFQLRALIEYAMPPDFRDADALLFDVDHIDSAVPSVPTDDKVVQKQDGTATKHEHVTEPRHKGKGKVKVKEEGEGSDDGKGEVGIKKEEYVDSDADQA